jgi:transposase-like protein
MTDEMMSLQALLEKSPDTDQLREMIGFAAHRLMELEVESLTGISKSQVSRLCGEIDGKIAAFLDRPLEGEWPYLWLDATYVKARRDGHVVSVAVIVAVGVNGDGRREVLGLAIGTFGS